jgi:hypothetical protein
MRLTPPKKVVFNVALVLAVLGLVAIVASFFVAFKFTLLIGAVLSLVAWALLAAGNALKGF